jgi:hypothetical protein
MSLRGEKRTEFPQKVRKLAFARCCRDGTQPGIPQCERPGCGAVLRSGNIEYEHLIPDGLGGTPTLDNCGVWCAVPCSSVKTHSVDNPTMRKADRVTKRAFGLMPKKQAIKSPGFAKKNRTHAGRPPVARKERFCQ